MFLVCRLQELTIVDVVVMIVVGAAHSTGNTEVLACQLLGNGSSQ